MNKKIFKKIYLWLNDKTIKTHFSFDAEYARWEKFNANVSYNKISPVKLDKKPDIYFLVPGVKISGGIAVILQYANRLLRRGYDVRILSLNNKNNTDWFPSQEVEIIPYAKIKKILKSKKIDILIATGYSTAFSVAMANAKRKIYFVQSDESRFFSEDKELTEKIKKTYRLPLEYITMAQWLQKWLKDKFNQKAAYVPNGIDLDVFKKIPSIESKGKKPRILIEGAINISYKGMDDAYNAIKDIDCEIWIVSNNGKPRKDWRYDRFFENVPYGEMNKIYSSCDILLKMSKVESFCYPPLEMMACGGVAVIKKVSGIEEYAVDGENCLIIENIESAKNAINKIIFDKNIRMKLIINGQKTVIKWSWDKSTRIMEYIINK